LAIERSVDATVAAERAGTTLSSVATNSSMVFGWKTASIRSGKYSLSHQAAR
jgi:hypothetical protein